MQHGLAVGRAIHDRDNATLCNPYNEIECSDHHSQAMASHGAFQAACGFHCHGPKGRVALAPRLAPDDFRAAFTTAEGWGTFSQQRTGTQMKAAIEVRRGRLRLHSLCLVPKDSNAIRHVALRLGDREISGKIVRQAEGLTIELDAPVRLNEGERIEITLS